MTSTRPGVLATVASLRDAAADARRDEPIIEKRGAGRDHPVLMGVRETRYLKCLVLRVL